MAEDPANKETTVQMAEQAARSVGFSRTELRRILDRMLIGDADLAAFCIDYFPEVARLFADGMSRLAKVNLLLERVNVEQILTGLNEQNSILLQREINSMKGGPEEPNKFSYLPKWKNTTNITSQNNHIINRWALRGTAGALLIAGLVVLSIRYIVAVEARNPEVGIDPDTGQVVVVGLPDRHGWHRGQMVFLQQRKELAGSSVVKGIGVAIIRDEQPNAVIIDPLCQEPNSLLEKALASMVTKDQAQHAVHCFGRIDAQEGARVRISLGQLDGVEEGYRYEACDVQSPERCVGMLLVRKVERLTAWAEVLEAMVPVQVGMYVLFHDGRPTTVSRSRVILVLNLTPLSEENREQQSSGQRTAAKLAAALQEAVKASSFATVPEISIRYAPEVQLSSSQKVSDIELQVRQLGALHGADLVLWGTMGCANDKKCATLRTTLITSSESSPGERSNFLNKDLTIDLSKAPEDPKIIASIILGHETFCAGRYADAGYYLRRAVQSKAFQGEDEIFAYGRIVYALQAQGYTGMARTYLHDLLNITQHNGDQTWEWFGRGALASLNRREGINNLKGRSKVPLNHDEQTVFVESMINKHQRNLPLEITGGPEAVKSWFDGKVPFAVQPPRVETIASLRGGRLSHLGDREAAYLQYEQKGHRISVFVFDATGYPLQPHRQVIGNDDIRLVRDHNIGYAITGPLSEARTLDKMSTAIQNYHY